MYHAIIMITDVSKIQLVWMPRCYLDWAWPQWNGLSIDFHGLHVGFYPILLESVGCADVYLDPCQLNKGASIISVRYDVAGLWWGRLKSWLLHRFS